MTKDQLEMALASKQALQKILDQRFNTLNKISNDYKSSGKHMEGVVIGNRAEMYDVLGLVCATEVGMYSSMLLQMVKKEQNNEA